LLGWKQDISSEIIPLNTIFHEPNNEIRYKGMLFLFQQDSHFGPGCIAVYHAKESDEIQCQSMTRFVQVNLTQGIKKQSFISRTEHDENDYIQIAANRCEEYYDYLKSFLNDIPQFNTAQVAKDNVFASTKVKISSEIIDGLLEAERNFIVIHNADNRTILFHLLLRIFTFLKDFYRKKLGSGLNLPLKNNLTNCGLLNTADANFCKQ
jgi:hypothetical protein